MKRLLAVILFISLFTLPSYSFTKDKIGTTGAQFLKIDLGAKPAAMSGAYTAAADDINAIYWNPAGLDNSMATEFSATHTLWFEDISLSYAAAAFPAFYGKLGIAAEYLTVGTIEKYDNEDNLLDDKYTASDMAGYLTFSKEFYGIPSGITLKYINSKIEEESATAIALDLGVQKMFGINRSFGIGVVVRNIGTKMKYITEEGALPLNIRTGLLVRPLGDKLSLTTDIDAYTDNSLKFRVGAQFEKSFGNIYFYPRAGFRTTDLNELDTIAGVTAGIGVSVSGLSFDYAWAPYWELGQTHRITASYALPEQSLEKKVKPKKKKKEKKQKEEKEVKEEAKKKKVAEKLRVAVTDLDAKNVSTMEASTVSDFLRGELINADKFIVIERNNMEKILAEQAFQQTGCTTAECAVRIGKMLNVEAIIVGSFSKMMGLFYITVRLVDVEKGTAILSETVKCKGGDDLFAAIKVLAKKISKRLD